VEEKVSEIARAAGLFPGRKDKPVTVTRVTCPQETVKTLRHVFVILVQTEMLQTTTRTTDTATKMEGTMPKKILLIDDDPI